MAYVRPSVSAPFFFLASARVLSRRIGQFFGGHVCGLYPRILDGGYRAGGLKSPGLKSVRRREWATIDTRGSVS